MLLLGCCVSARSIASTSGPDGRTGRGGRLRGSGPLVRGSSGDVVFPGSAALLWRCPSDPTRFSHSGSRLTFLNLPLMELLVLTSFPPRFWSAHDKSLGVRPNRSAMWGGTKNSGHPELRRAVRMARTARVRRSPNSRRMSRSVIHEIVVGEAFFRWAGWVLFVFDDGVEWVSSVMVGFLFIRDI